MRNEEIRERFNDFKHNLQQKFSDVSHFVQEKFHHLKEEEIHPEDIDLGDYHYESHRVDVLPEEKIRH